MTPATRIHHLLLALERARDADLISDGVYTLAVQELQQLALDVALLSDRARRDYARAQGYY